MPCDLRLCSLEWWVVLHLCLGRSAGVLQRRIWGIPRSRGRDSPLGGTLYVPHETRREARCWCFAGFRRLGECRPRGWSGSRGPTCLVGETGLAVEAIQTRFTRMAPTLYLLCGLPAADSAWRAVAWQGTGTSRQCLSSKRI